MTLAIEPHLVEFPSRYALEQNDRIPSSGHAASTYLSVFLCRPHFRSVGGSGLAWRVFRHFVDQVIDGVHSNLRKFSVSS
jgi:hypothetical protein